METFISECQSSQNEGKNQNKQTDKKKKKTVSECLELAKHLLF